MNKVGVLAMRRVLNTRAADQASELSEPLRALGAEVVELPLLEINFPLSSGELRHHLANLERTDWLVFTSANGVRAFSEELLLLCRVAVIGERTGRGLQKVDFVSRRSFAEGFASEFGAFLRSEQIRGRKILICRGEIAEESFPRLLREEMATCSLDIQELTVYRNRLPGDALSRAKLSLTHPLDAVICTSSQCVKNLLSVATTAFSSAHPQTIHPEKLLSLPLFVIGPKTAATATALGFSQIITPPTPSIPALLTTLTHSLAP